MDCVIEEYKKRIRPFGRNVSSIQFVHLFTFLMILFFSFIELRKREREREREKIQFHSKRKKTQQMPCKAINICIKKNERKRKFDGGMKRRKKSKRK